MQPTSMVCAHCGWLVEPTARWCGNCGTSLRAEPAVLSTVPVIRAPHESSLQAGTRLGANGRYQVERLLGRGGFGAAYLARDTQLNRACVVKQLVLSLGWTARQQEMARASFAREAALLVSLNAPGHPNIPEIYDYLPQDTCLVMKHIAGRSLDQLLTQRSGLPEEVALRYTRDVCAALVYMHRRTPEPVMHRDLKPDNILLDAEDRVWLIDFGLAKGWVTPADATPGGSGIAGTPGYAPPEQWAGQPEPRSDVYALGATLHYLLTGEPPRQTDVHSLAVGATPVVTQRQLAPELRSEIAQVIARTLSYTIADRPSAQELLVELDALLEQHLGSAPPAPARPPDSRHFVGRATELATLTQQLASTGLAIITGLAGAGKTALAAELVRRIAPSSHIFWQSFHAYEGFDGVLWALAGMLAHNRQPELWRMLHTRQHPPPETLIDYLLHLLDNSSYLLVFDDLHLVDEQPLMQHLCRRLAAAARAGHIRLVITARRQPGFDTSSLAPPLAGLSATDAKDLLAQRGAYLPEEVIDALLRATGGNAQLLILAGTATQQAADPHHLVAHLAESDDIERYLLHEIDATLSETEREVMGAVAALLDDACSRDMLSALLGRGGLGQALTSLHARHLLLVETGQKRYRQHAILSTFFYGQLGRQQRRELHGRAGAYYETELDNTLAAARHFLLAGEQRRAVLLATSDIWRLVNNGEARALLHLLAQFDLNRLDTESALALLIARGEVAALLRVVPEARTSYEQAATRLKTMSSNANTGVQWARICRGMGELLEYESPQKALEWLQRGLDAIDGRDAGEERLLHLRIGSVLIGTGAYDAAQTALSTALRLLPDSADDRRAEALDSLGVIACSQGEIERGRHLFLEALAIYERLGYTWRMVSLWHNLARIKEISGDWAGAAVEYQRALESANQLGRVNNQVLATLMLGILHMKWGEHTTAFAHLSEAVALAREHSLSEQHVAALASLADLWIRWGEWVPAANALAEAQQVAHALNLQDQQPEIDWLRAQIALAQGESVSALELATHATNQARALGLDFETGMALRTQALALLATGQRNAALEAFTQSLQLVADDSYEVARTQAAYGRALLDSDPQGGQMLLDAARVTFFILGAQQDLTAIKRDDENTIS